MIEIFISIITYFMFDMWLKTLNNKEINCMLQAMYALIPVFLDFGSESKMLVGRATVHFVIIIFIYKHQEKLKKQQCFLYICENITIILHIWTYWSEIIMGVFYIFTIFELCIIVCLIAILSVVISNIIIKFILIVLKLVFEYIVNKFIK